MIYGFKTKKVPSLSQVGGKAKALIETTKAGFEVPEGFVLSVEFFDSWIQEIKSTDQWKGFLTSPTKQMCDELKRRASKLEFNEVQRKALQKEFAALSEKTVFAVRSSSPEEDLEDTSFAGQYETILGVTHGKLESAIVEAFTSMLDTRVVEYKKLNDIPLDNPRIAIIVQKQIASDVSGIAFSLNPSNNCYDEAMINASFGLGETIVSGQVTPDTYIVEKVKRQILDKKVMEKSFGLWLKDDGGTIKRVNKKPKEQALTNKQILMVAELASRCEAHYGKPMDIEWAIEDGKLYLLQSRPITTYLPLFPELITKPEEEKYLYIDIMGLTQGFTESMSVLGLDIWEKMLEIAKAGTMPTGFDGAVVAIHGRQYMHISNLLKGLGFKSVNKIFQGYDAPTRRALESVDLNDYLPTKKTDKMKKVYGSMLKMALNIGPGAIKATFSDHRKIRDEYIKISDKSKAELRLELSTCTPFDQSIRKGLSHFEKMMGSIGILIAGMTSLAKIKKLFKGQDIEDLVISLGMDLDGNPTSAMGHYMYKLACYDEIKKTKSGEEFARRIADRNYSKEFLEDYDSYMELYGSRGFKEIDIASPRTYDDPESFFNQLAHINTEKNHLQGVKERRKKAYNQLLEKAIEGGFEKKFIKYATKYQETFGFREDPKFVYVMVVDQLRRLALQIGDQFVREGRLETKEQVFDLTSAQIVNAQKNKSFDLMKSREENVKPYKLVEHIKNWPNIIDSRGKIIRPISTGEEGDIIGDPIAPGIVRGKAKVLHGPYEKPLEPGEILVTKATEPAWTPIFVNAAGVVLEVGGPLQHGAIIAREYGIPCVSGIYNAQSIIKDGDMLEVDGSSGIVRIIG
ncbi:PEP/pyruvate-binding domain-containing protein [Wukongibacter baidiensis]|uniref:PEP/pyruvate-binding domain-containing protein n=1 Tax=Wukongibacter baidiensis TaxID=1723361 RepID=UPI003D7F206E